MKGLELWCAAADPHNEMDHETANDNPTRTSVTYSVRGRAGHSDTPEYRRRRNGVNSAPRAAARRLGQPWFGHHGVVSGFRGSDDAGRTVEDLTPANLRELLRTAEQYVVVENPGWGAEFSGRAQRLGDSGAWRVEIRSGPAWHLATTAANVDATFDILRSWAAADGWWQEAFVWRPVDAG